MTADSIWQWQPLAMAIIFFLMLISVASLTFYNNEKKMLLTIISWVGAVISLYAIFQYFGVDQYFRVVGLQKGEMPDAYQVCGTFGQPTLLASFLAIILPLVVSIRKYIPAALILIALLLTQSHVAYIAAFISIIILVGVDTRARQVISVFLLCSMIVAGSYIIEKNNKSIPDSGRFGAWSNIVNDAKKYAITGKGLGSFAYVYHDKHPGTGTTSKFKEAHNDFLQFGYETGLIGLGLLLLALGAVIKKARNKKYLLAALMASVLCAFGSFPYQLGAHIYYTIFIIGLIYAREGGQLGNASPNM
jgi:O-antigen ligase